MRRVRLELVPGLEVEFTDREKALRQVYELAEKGTRYPIVVYGPEGCGKTAWLKQSALVLRELGYETLYVNPLHREATPYTDVREVALRLAEAVAEASGTAQLRLATLAVLLVRELLSRWRRGRVAVLVDDVFQAIGLDKAEVYVKELLGPIEYPPQSYERVVAIVATSEGVTRRRVGRHRWALLRSMWNMSRRGLEELYEELRRATPGGVEDFDEVWRLTGGNPYMLSRLYQANWSRGTVVRELIVGRGLSREFVVKWRGYLEAVVEDPDAVSEPGFPEELRAELIERNLITYDIYFRDPELWVDEPPPGRDLELGIGRYAAWQTPLHREAVRAALREFSP